MRRMRHGWSIRLARRHRARAPTKSPPHRQVFADGVVAGVILGPDLLDAIVVTTGPECYRRADGIAVVPAAQLGP